LQVTGIGRLLVIRAFSPKRVVPALSFAYDVPQRPFSAARNSLFTPFLLFVDAEALSIKLLFPFFPKLD